MRLISRICLAVLLLAALLAPGHLPESVELRTALPVVMGADGLPQPAVPAQAPVRASVKGTTLATGTAVAATAPTSGSATAGATPDAKTATGSTGAPLGSTSADQANSSPLLAVLPAREVATNGAELVGVSWTGKGPDRVEIRSHATGGDWGDWTVVDLIDPTRGTEPIWVGSSDRVQVRAVAGGVSVVDHLKVNLVRSTPTAADATLAAAATAAAAQLTAFTKAPDSPVIISRAQWGADESLRSDAPRYGDTVKAVTIHHTAGSNSYTASQSASIVRAIYAYHTQTLGWSDIGYNVLVDRYGQIFEGRAGGLNLPVVGAHAGGFNWDTMGISMMGNFQTEAPPQVTLEQVARVAAWKLAGSYRFDAWGIETLTAGTFDGSKFPLGMKVQVYRIFGHRDVDYTDCPGNVGYSYLGWLRDRTNQLISGGLAAAFQGPVYAAWNANGGAAKLGPVSQIETNYGTGTAAYFDPDNGTSGTTIAQSPTYGTRAITPATRAGWMANGGFGLGWPATDVFPVGDKRGVAQEFVPTSGPGASVLATPTTGQKVIGGAIRNTWWALGGAYSVPGYPTRSQGPVGDGRGTFAEFEVASTIISSPTTGAHWISGALRSRWWQGGGASASGFGYPTTDQTHLSDGVGYVIDFESNVSIVWGPNTGAFPLFGPLRDRWRAGGLREFGYPSGEPVNFVGVAGGYSPTTSGAWIVWSPAGGAVKVPAAVLAVWRQRGAANGTLGVPLAEPVVNGRTTTQRFAGGTVTVTS